jgi:hypothetical protein
MVVKKMTTPEAGSAAEQRISSVRFDIAFALTSVLLIAGGVIDTWAHSFNVAGAQETLFTPWHALFYAGFSAVALLLAVSIVRGIPPGMRSSLSLPALRAAIPRGYTPSVLGLAVFLSGGILDPIWHAIAGREASLEILISPAHMIFMAGGTLIITGPFRAAWQREGQPRGLGSYLTVLLPLLLLQWGAVFPMLYAHPIQVAPGAHLRGTLGYLFSPAIGTVGMMWYCAVLMAVVLLALRRWRLPFGSFALVIGGHFLMLSPQVPQYPGMVLLLLAVTASGLLIDALAAVLNPTYEQPYRLFAFAFLMPVLLFGGYFAAIYAASMMAWTLHLIVGNIVIAGAIGLSEAAIFVTLAKPLRPPAGRAAPPAGDN